MKENKIKRSFLLRITAAMKAAGPLGAAWEYHIVYKQLLKLRKLAKHLNKISWYNSTGQLMQFILDLMMVKLWDIAQNNENCPPDKKTITRTPPPFKLFQPGNGKLPFLSWSTLPGFNCPGAGSCWVLAKNKFSGWCYSVKAWRYPAAYLRQLQNTVLEQTPAGRQIIRQELKKELKRPIYRGLDNIPLRLYVDGDFSSLELLRWWMDLAKEFPQLKIYGYSKSLHLFKELARTGYEWPTNYALNGSSGSKYENTPTHKAAAALPIWRGNFEAVPVSAKTLKSWKSGKLTRAAAQEIRSSYPDKKVFICPGLCGSCTSKGHACGDQERFNNTTIVIPQH